MWSSEVRVPFITASSTSATSTLPNIKINNISANTSAGLLVYSNNHTQIADFGAGSSANSIFFGGVNINGATRLATSLNGVLQATAGAVTATTTGTLTETVTGLQFDSTGALIGGSAILSLTFGYDIPLSASTTQWSGFYNTPSGRITANDGLTWSGNNLNFDGGNAPGGELGGTWSSPTIDDSLAVTSWNLTTPTLTSFFGTPCTGNNFLQDISDTGAFTCVTATGGTGSNWTLMSGGLRTSTSTDFARAAYFVATSTTATSSFPILSVSTVFSLFGNIYSTLANFGTGVVQAITSVAPTGTWNFNGATVKQHTYKSFTWPGTATTTSATTTLPLGTAYTAEAWNSAECWVTNSTGAVIFTDGTNRMNGFTATTTAARTTLSTNNTFTVSERRYAEVGILTAAQLSCSLDVTVNN